MDVSNIQALLALTDSKDLPAKAKEAGERATRYSGELRLLRQRRCASMGLDRLAQELSRVEKQRQQLIKEHEAALARLNAELESIARDIELSPDYMDKLREAKALATASVVEYNTLRAALLLQRFVSSVDLTSLPEIPLPDTQ